MRLPAPVLLQSFLPPFFIDFAFHAGFFTLQHLLDDRLAGRREPAASRLALLAAAQPLVYAVLCPLLGSVSDARGRRASALLGALLFGGILAVFLGHVPDALFYVAMALFGLAGALFWPAAQARLGERCGRAALGKAMLAFNLGWTAGKALGYAVAGELFARGLSTVTLALAASACFATALLVLLDRSASMPDAPGVLESSNNSGVPVLPKDRKRGFLVAGLVTIVAAWGGQKMLVGLAPELGRTVGLDARHQGTVLSALVVAQAVAFFAMTRPAGWAYRAGPLAALAPLVAVAAIGTFYARGFVSVLLPALLLGVVTGTAYTSSFFYSSDYDERRGLRMGLNEAAIGVGGLLPLLGGTLSERWDEPRVPYLVVAWAAALASAVVFFALRRAGPVRG